METDVLSFLCYSVLDLILDISEGPLPAPFSACFLHFPPLPTKNNGHTRHTKWWTFAMAKTKIEKILKWHNEARMIKNYLRFISWHKDFHENKKKCWWYKGWGMHYNLFHHCALINKKMVLSVCLSMGTCIKDTKPHPTLHFNKITLK